MFSKRLYVGAVAVICLSLVLISADAEAGRRPTLNKITGSGQDDSLHGGMNADLIDGRGGDDFLNGWGGNDLLIGGSGRDVFVLHTNGGYDTVLDFSITDGDILLLDFVSNWSVRLLGPLSDGQTFTNVDKTATYTVHAVDANGDGVTDTLIDYNLTNGVIILNYAPSDLTGSILAGY